MRHLALCLTAVSLLLASCEVVDPATTRQEEVARRGAQVMPFDLERTTHVFEPLPDGGVQKVVSDDPSDETQVRLIRSHLRHEAAAFQGGDFGDPEEIHGHDMPGLRVLRAAYGEIDVDLSKIEAGAQIRYTTSSRRVVEAIHDWFAAQVSDHGDHAEHDR